MRQQHAVQNYRQYDLFGTHRSTGRLWLYGVAITAGLMILMQMPELRRYFRIRSM